jgi:hypothetical protein
MDAVHYPDIPLSAIINTLSEMSLTQQILCKITGIFPDKSLKLQWMVQKDPNSQKLVFINNFFQKIDFKKKEPKKKQVLTRNKEELTEQYVGKILSLKADSLGCLFFRIDDKYIGKILVGDINYPNCSIDTLKEALNQVPNGQHFLCKVKSIQSDLSMKLQWMIEDDPAARELVRSIIDREETKKQEIIEKYGKKTLYLEVLEVQKNTLILRVDEKCTGIMQISKNKYPEIPRKLFQKALSRIKIGQHLFCRVTGILSNSKVGLRWMIEEDPVADELLGIKRETKEKTIEHKKYNQLLTGVRPGGAVQAKIVDFTGNELRCSIGNKRTGYLPLASHLYHGLPRQVIKQLLHQISDTDTIMCQVIGMRPDKSLRLKWLIDVDPVAKRVFFFNYEL